MVVLSLNVVITYPSFPLAHPGVLLWLLWSLRVRLRVRLRVFWGCFVWTKKERWHGRDRLEMCWCRLKAGGWRMERNLEFGCATRATHASSENKDKHTNQVARSSSFLTISQRQWWGMREEINLHRRVASLSTALMWEHSLREKLKGLRHVRSTIRDVTSMPERWLPRRM